MSGEIEKFKVGPLEVTIGHDDEPGSGNPRQWDQLGTMTCWHPDYILGDEQFKAPNGRGAIETPADPQGFQSLEHLGRYLSLMKEAICVLPLYLYDHSGITINVGKAGDYGFDSAGWDSTDVGFIWTTKARVEELGAPEKDIEKQLRTEVEEYDSYLRGEVYEYAITNEDGETIAGCGGMIGGLEWVMEEAKAEAEALAPDEVFVDALSVEESIPKGER